MSLRRICKFSIFQVICLNVFFVMFSQAYGQALTGETAIHEIEKGNFEFLLKNNHGNNPSDSVWRTLCIAIIEGAVEAQYSLGYPDDKTNDFIVLDEEVARYDSISIIECLKEFFEFAENYFGFKYEDFDIFIDGKIYGYRFHERNLGEFTLVFKEDKEGLYLLGLSYKSGKAKVIQHVNKLQYNGMSELDAERMLHHYPGGIVFTEHDMEERRKKEED